MRGEKVLCVKDKAMQKTLGPSPVKFQKHQMRSLENHRSTEISGSCWSPETKLWTLRSLTFMKVKSRCIFNDFHLNTKTPQKLRVVHPGWYQPFLPLQPSSSLDSGFLSPFHTKGSQGETLCPTVTWQCCQAVTFSSTANPT